jgi:hypothetical protein
MRAFMLIVCSVVILGAAVSVCRSVEVYPSKLSSNKVMVRVSDEEALMVKRDLSVANQLGREVTGKMLLLVGVPESVTGKVAAATVAAVLWGRYSNDIRDTVKEYGQGFTLGYYVEIEKLRALWSASAVGDPLMPGTEASKALIDIINELANDANESD